MIGRRIVWPALTLALALSATPGVRAQAPNFALSNAIPPTVTAADGDRDGKFFGNVPDPSRTHRYYIAAEPELWDFAPQGRDPVCGKPMPPPLVAPDAGFGFGPLRMP